MSHLVRQFTSSAHHWVATAYSVSLEHLACGWYEDMERPNPKEPIGCPVKKLSNLTQTVIPGNPSHE